MLSEAVRSVLADLSERERKVVCLRFGLEDGQAHTLEEVGKAFGVTPVSYTHLDVYKRQGSGASRPH